MPYQFSCQYPY